MGTPSQLQTMINSCHTAGVRVYADIVVNQMADGSGTATDGSTWNAATLSYPFFSASDWEKIPASARKGISGSILETVGHDATEALMAGSIDVMFDPMPSSIARIRHRHG